MDYDTKHLNLEILEDSYLLSDDYHRHTNCIQNHNHNDKYKYSLLKLSHDLITYDQLPEWYSNNPYIYYGYRKPELSIFKLIKSIFTLHNETFNIWSHLIGIIIFISIQINFIIKYYSYPISSIPISLFLIGTISCFTNSVIMHTLYPHSKKCCSILCSFDYGGIFTLIFTGYIAFLHYEFYCYTKLQIMYYILLSIVGVLSFFLVCHKNYIIRSASFLMLGLSSFVPIIHRRVFLKGNQDIIERIDIQLYLLLGTLTVAMTGIFFYISYIPERLHKDFFNIVFSSHQLFHVCTIIAAYLYYSALIELFDYYKFNNCV